MGNKFGKGGSRDRAIKHLFQGVPRDIELLIRNQAVRTSDDLGRGALSTELTVSVYGNEVSAGLELTKPDLTRPISFSIDSQTGDARLDMPGISVFGRASTCAGIARSITGQNDFKV